MIFSPSAYVSPFFGVLVVSFVTVMCGLLSSVVTVFSPLPVTSLPLGSLPVAVAWFTICPSIISASVTVYSVVLTACSPGCNVPTSLQLSPVLSSVRLMLSITVLPLFVTVIV